MPASTRFLAISFASALKVMRRIFADRSLIKYGSRSVKGTTGRDSRWFPLTFLGPSHPKGGSDDRTKQSHLVGRNVSYCKTPRKCTNIKRRYSYRR